MGIEHVPSFCEQTPTIFLMHYYFRIDSVIESTIVFMNSSLHFFLI